MFQAASKNGLWVLAWEARLPSPTPPQVALMRTFEKRQQTTFALPGTAPMDFLRAGEALLRSSQPILPFLAPSASRTSAPRRIAHCLHQQQPSRALSTTSRHHSDVDEFSKLLDQALEQNKNVPTAPQGRTSRFASNRAQQRQRTSPSTRMAAERGRSVMDDILDDMKNPGSRSSGAFGGSGSIQDMLSRDDFLDPNRTNVPATPQAPPTPPVKLDSSVGRTIPINDQRGMDVGRAFRTLEMRCAQNSVKRDFMRQRFHERGGLKRKRLKSERWRRRFKGSFTATIKLVQGLKKQGW